MADEDCFWKELQAQWGVNGFSIACTLIRLEVAITTALASVDGGPPRMTETLLSPKEELTNKWPPPWCTPYSFQQVILMTY